MKILHFSAGFPLSYQGGITNYVRSLAESQYDNGDEVWVIGGTDVQQYPFKYYTYESKKIRNLTLGKLKDQVSLEKIKLFLHEEKFDVIHLHMVLNIDWNLFKILKPYKYIVSLHDYFYLCPRIFMLTPQKEVCQYYSEKKCEKCVSRLEEYFVFQKVKRGVKKLFGLNLKTPYIYHDLTKIRFSKMKQLLEGAKILLPVSSRVQKIYKESGIINEYETLHIGNISADKYVDTVSRNIGTDNKICIAMMGSISYLKGAEILIRLAKSIDRNRYVVHFYGQDGGYKKKMLECGIVFHGPYNQDELGDILNKIDIGLVLSVWEDNGPQVVMEFLNNHIPVVATKMGGIPDFINQFNGFLFDPYSINGFDQMIDFFDELTIEKIRLLQNGIVRTTTTQEHYNELIKVYKSVLEN
jgi:glycosyltransferase involved in cell wall biosynthesis